MKLLLPLALVLVGCIASHPTNGVDVARSECSTCHLNDHNAATRMTVHSQNGIDPNATPCSSCHRIVDTGAGATDWAPALLAGTHQQDLFDIQQGPHAQVLCADCHDPTVNKDSTVFPPVGDPNHDTPTNVRCVGCHTTQPGTTIGVHALDVMAKIDGHVEQQTNYATYMSQRGGELFCRNCHAEGRR